MTATGSPVTMIACSCFGLLDKSRKSIIRDIIYDERAKRSSCLCYLSFYRWVSHSQSVFASHAENRSAHDEAVRVQCFRNRTEPNQRIALATQQTTVLCCAHKHRLSFLPHAFRHTLRHLPRPTCNTVSRARVVESKPSKKYLQQSVDRRCRLLARRVVHPYVQRDIAMGPSVEWVTRKTGALRSAGERPIQQYDRSPFRQSRPLLSFCHRRDKCR